MLTTTVEVESVDYQRLLELSESTVETVQVVLSKAIDEYYKNVFFAQVNQDYERLQNDPHKPEE